MLDQFNQYLVPIIGILICAGVVIGALYCACDRPDTKPVESFNPPEVNLGIGDWIMSILCTGVGLWFLYGIIWIAKQIAFPPPWWAE